MSIWGIYFQSTLYVGEGTQFSMTRERHFLPQENHADEKIFQVKKVPRPDKCGDVATLLY
jgi:hypothetical protein